MKRKADAFTGQSQQARDRSRSLGCAEAQTSKPQRAPGGIFSGITLLECFLALMILAILGVMFLTTLSHAQDAVPTITLEAPAG